MVLGLPVALYGVVFSSGLVIACLAWWRGARPSALYVAYGLGLAGTIAVAYLTYLEIVVIGAICVWCATFALTVVAGWILAAVVAMRGRAHV